MKTKSGCTGWRLEDQGPLCNDPVSQAVVVYRQENFHSALTVLQEEFPLEQHSKMTLRLQSKVQKIVEKRYTLADFKSCYECHMQGYTPSLGKLPS